MRRIEDQKEEWQRCSDGVEKRKRMRNGTHACTRLHPLALKTKGKGEGNERLSVCVWAESKLAQVGELAVLYGRSDRTAQDLRNLRHSQTREIAGGTRKPGDVG